MKQIVLGTAGHIDHGKTALVKALTGINTDRLKEEQERGITIELGFASLALPGGHQLGIVDVPGHERFVKHMVAGVSGIDIVALVVAADEGIMPQTREHLDICRLLNVKKGLVVITKIDLAGEELLQLVEGEIHEFVQGTFLEKAPILRVSSVTGEGIDGLLMALNEIAQETMERTADGLLRLPIDRVFVMKGFGTVVTGTMISGQVRVGDGIQILPPGHEAKVRGIQVHNTAVQLARAGQRAALNLQGVEKAMINRGEVICHPHSFHATQVLDGELEHLRSSPRPLRNRVQQRFHIGTSLVEARIILLDREELKPEEKAMVQFRLDTPVVALPKDRFVIRGSSAVQTLGGGVVLNSHPIRHKRFSPAVITELTLLRDGALEDVANYHVLQGGHRGISFPELLEKTGYALPDEVRGILDKLLRGNRIVAVGNEEPRYVHRSVYEELKEEVVRCLKDFHIKSPMAIGFSKEELKTKLPRAMEPRLFQLLLSEMIQTHQVIVEKDKIRSADHRITAAEDVLDEIERIIRTGQLQPPSVKELADQLLMKEDQLRNHLEILVNRGMLVRIKGDLYFHHDPIHRLKGALIDFLRVNREISTSQFKDLTKVSRKFTIPLLEFFDNNKVTIRTGDKRILRGSVG